MTLRDDTWNASLELLVKQQKFKVDHLVDHLNEESPDDVEISDDQRQTIRRCLRQLEDKGWVERTTEQSEIWRIGWKGEVMLETSADLDD